MTTVKVEVTLENFDLDDIISELEDRMVDINRKDFRRLRNSLLNIDTVDKEKFYLLF